MMPRLTITIKDIMNILGKSHSAAQRRYATIKDALGKKNYQCITIKEYCDYEGFDYDTVIKTYIK